MVSVSTYTPDQRSVRSGGQPCGFLASVILLSSLCLQARLSHPQVYGFWSSHMQVPLIPFLLYNHRSVLHVYSFNSKKKTQNRDQIAHLLLKLIALNASPPCPPVFKG